MRVCLMLSAPSLFVSHQAQASGGRLIEDGTGTVTCVHINMSDEPDDDSFSGRFHGLPENK